MNLMISSKEYDFHSLIKVAEMAGLAGVVSFHPAGDDYLVTFPDCEAAPQMAAISSRAPARAGKQHLELLNLPLFQRAAKTTRSLSAAVSGRPAGLRKGILPPYFANSNQHVPMAFF